MELHWTYLGFADDTPEMRARRLKQNNLVGPAGYVSMEDGCVGGFVQRGIAAAADELSVVEMGGDGAETQETRATEASVRGFWKAYRPHMGCDDEQTPIAFRLAALNAEYAALHRRRPARGVARLLPEPCLYKITTADNHRRGYAGRPRSTPTRAACWRTGSPRCARPTSTSGRAIATSSACPRLRAGGRRSSAETPFLVVRIMRDGRMDLFATGRLPRSRADEAGALRFAERVVVCDSRASTRCWRYRCRCRPAAPVIARSQRRSNLQRGGHFDGDCFVASLLAMTVGQHGEDPSTVLNQGGIARAGPRSSATTCRRPTSATATTHASSTSPTSR